jgi:hypothetical protein
VVPIGYLERQFHSCMPNVWVDDPPSFIFLPLIDDVYVI